MTVAELIEELQRVPNRHMPVVTLIRVPPLFPGTLAHREEEIVEARFDGNRVVLERL